MHAKFISTELSADQRYQAAARTNQRSGSPLSVSDPPSVSTGEGWTWAIIAVLGVVGLAVLGLSPQ